MWDFWMRSETIRKHGFMLRFLFRLFFSLCFLSTMKMLSNIMYMDVSITLCGIRPKQIPADIMFIDPQAWKLPDQLPKGIFSVDWTHKMWIIVENLRQTNFWVYLSLMIEYVPNVSVYMCVFHLIRFISLHFHSNLTNTNTLISKHVRITR